MSNSRWCTKILLGLSLLSVFACGEKANQTPAITSHSSEVAESAVVPAATQLSEQVITVDDKAYGTLLTSSGDALSKATWIGAIDPTSMSFAKSKELYISALVDLKKSGPLRRGRTSQSNFRTRHLKIPALILWSVAEGNSTGSVMKEVVLLDARTGLQLYRGTVERRDADGYGGFSLKSLRIEAKGNAIFIRGSHQDHLPSSRRRCLKPKPYPVEYRWDGSRFISQPRKLDVSRDGC